MATSATGQLTVNVNRKKLSSDERESYNAQESVIAEHVREIISMEPEYLNNTD